MIENLSNKESTPANFTDEFEIRFKEILQSQVDEVKGSVMEAFQNISAKKTGVGFSEKMSYNTRSNYNTGAVSSHSHNDVTYNSNAVNSQSRRSSMAPTLQALTLKTN